MCSHAAVPVVVLCFGVAGASGGCVGIVEPRAGGLAIDRAARQPPARPSAVPGASRAVVDGHVDTVPGASPQDRMLSPLRQYACKVNAAEEVCGSLLVAKLH